jgi:hypothetical protein
VKNNPATSVKHCPTRMVYIGWLLTEPITFTFIASLGMIYTKKAVDMGKCIEEHHKQINRKRKNTCHVNIVPMLEERTTK